MRRPTTARPRTVKAAIRALDEQYTVHSRYGYIRDRETEGYRARRRAMEAVMATGRITRP
jgi:hypothetical protein